jgi:hypothetical protein
LTQQQQAFALGTFAGISLLLTFLGADPRPSDFALLDESRFFLRMLGIGLAAVFVGVTLERTEAFGLVWRYAIAKILASLALSALVIYSAGHASAIINGVFGVDAAALPYARALLTGWIAFAHVAKPAMVLVGCFAAMHLLFVLWMEQRGAVAIGPRRPAARLPVDFQLDRRAVGHRAGQRLQLALPEPE